MQDAAAHYQVAIIGAGFGGLAMAIRLLQRNIHNFVILEKSNEVGGTWRENQYPGAACDVQSLYIHCPLHPKLTGQNVMPMRQKFFSIFKMWCNSLICVNIANLTAKWCIRNTMKKNVCGSLH